MSEDAEGGGIGGLIAKIVGAIVGCLLISVVGITVAVCGGMFAVGTGMNAGSFEVESVDASWHIEVRDGKFGGKSTNGAAAVAVKSALEQRCSPMVNGVNVLFQHLWYNTITDGYDLRVWLEPSDGYDNYGLYIWSNKVFFRDENSSGGYVNRVLSCDMYAEDWEAIIGPNVTGDLSW